MPPSPLHRAQTGEQGLWCSANPGSAVSRSQAPGEGAEPQSGHGVYP